MTLKQTKTRSPNIPSIDENNELSHLPRASERLGITASYPNEFDYDPDIEYYGDGDQEKEITPSSKEKLNEQNSREYLRFTADNATPNQARLSAEREKKANPKLFIEFLKKAQSKPNIPQWANRTTGREVSPVDWICMHYGNKKPGKNWDAAGMTRADLQHDSKLYSAYTTWIRRHPMDDLGITTKTTKKILDPQEATERRRESARKSAQRARQTNSI